MIFQGWMGVVRDGGGGGGGLNIAANGRLCKYDSVVYQ